MEDVGLLEPDAAGGTEKTESAASARRRKSGKDDDTVPPAPLAESIWSSVSSAAESVRGLVGLAGAEDGEGEGDTGDERGSLSVGGEQGAEGEGGSGASGVGAAEGGRELEPLDGGRGEEEEGERLHVFSLATGHLYERFLKVGVLVACVFGGLFFVFFLSMCFAFVRVKRLVGRSARST